MWHKNKTGKYIAVEVSETENEDELVAHVCPEYKALLTEIDEHKYFDTTFHLCPDCDCRSVDDDGNCESCGSSGVII